MVPNKHVLYFPLTDYAVFSWLYHIFSLPKMDHENLEPHSNFGWWRAVVEFLIPRLWSSNFSPQICFWWLRGLQFQTRGGFRTEKNKNYKMGQKGRSLQIEIRGPNRWPQTWFHLLRCFGSTPILAEFKRPRILITAWFLGPIIETQLPAFPGSPPRDFSEQKTNIRRLCVAAKNQHWLAQIVWKGISYIATSTQKPQNQRKLLKIFNYSAALRIRCSSEKRLVILRTQTHPAIQVQTSPIENSRLILRKVSMTQWINYILMYICILFRLYIWMYNEIFIYIYIFVE